MPEDNEKRQFSDEEYDRLQKLLEADKNGETATKTPKKERKRFSLATTPKWLVLLVGVVAVVALAFGYVRVVEPQIAKSNAAAELSNQAEKKPILAQNGELISFEAKSDSAKEIPKGVNPKQLGLGEDGKVTDSAAFVFASDEANADSHVIDIYMDFYSQRSRDFISLNQNALENKIQSGDVILRVHPVLNSEPFSVYAPEALAEVFGTAPDKAWGFFTNLLEDSITLTGQESSDEIVAFIAKHAQDNGGTEVDAASITNATFLTWLYTAAEDPKVAVGYIPPVLYVDDKELDQDKWRINDPEQMLKLFSTLN